MSHTPALPLYSNPLHSNLAPQTAADLPSKSIEADSMLAALIDHTHKDQPGQARPRAAALPQQPLCPPLMPQRRSRAPGCTAPPPAPRAAPRPYSSPSTWSSSPVCSAARASTSASSTAWRGILDAALKSRSITAT